MIQINILVRTEDGQNFIREYEFTKEKAEKILRSPENIVMITDNKGNWTGETINKNFIVSTENISDRNYTPINENLRIKEPSEEARQEEFKRVSEMIDNISEKLRKKRVISIKPYHKPYTNSFGNATEDDFKKQIEYNKLEVKN